MRGRTIFKWSSNTATVQHRDWKISSQGPQERIANMKQNDDPGKCENHFSKEVTHSNVSLGSCTNLLSRSGWCIQLSNVYLKLSTIDSFDPERLDSSRNRKTIIF